MPLRISNKVSIPDEEIELGFIRAQGAGGQNVNKVSSAVHLRFDIPASSLPDVYKGRLLALSDRRINTKGVVVIKAQSERTQERNRAAALDRLGILIRSVREVPERRLSTKPTRGARQRRLEAKSRRGRVKLLRRKVEE